MVETCPADSQERIGQQWVTDAEMTCSLARPSRVALTEICSFLHIWYTRETEWSSVGAAPAPGAASEAARLQVNQMLGQLRQVGLSYLVRHCARPTSDRVAQIGIDRSGGAAEFTFG